MPEAQDVTERILKGLKQKTKMTLVFDFDAFYKKAAVLDTQNPQNCIIVDLTDKQIEDVIASQTAYNMLEKAMIDRFKEKFIDYYWPEEPTESDVRA